MTSMTCSTFSDLKLGWLITMFSAISRTSSLQAHPLPQASQKAERIGALEPEAMVDAATIAIRTFAGRRTILSLDFEREGVWCETLSAPRMPPQWIVIPILAKPFSP